jgi:peroxiredoxin
MRSDIVPGAVFPDYELPDHATKRRKLSELQGQHPMILVLSRGGFCPKERRQDEGLAKLHRELEVAYCRLVTISTDNITQTNEYRSGVGAHWPFLPDPGRIVQKGLEIAEYTDPAHNPMIPHVIVLEPGPEFERRQIAAVRKELDDEYEAAVGLNVQPSKGGAQAKISSNSQT